jgi:hypothetical protein
MLSADTGLPSSSITQPFHHNCPRPFAVDLDDLISAGLAWSGSGRVVTSRIRWLVVCPPSGWSWVMANSTTRTVMPLGQAGARRRRLRRLCGVFGVEDPRQVGAVGQHLQHRQPVVFSLALHTTCAPVAVIGEDGNTSAVALLSAIVTFARRRGATVVAAYSQTARRWNVLTLQPFEVATATGRRTWRSLLLGIEKQLVLANQPGGMLADDLSDYLFARSNCHFASLMSLIGRGCYRAGQDRHRAAHHGAAGPGTHR